MSVEAILRLLTASCLLTLAGVTVAGAMTGEWLVAVVVGSYMILMCLVGGTFVLIRDTGGDDKQEGE